MERSESGCDNVEETKFVVMMVVVLCHGCSLDHGSHETSGYSVRGCQMQGSPSMSPDVDRYWQATAVEGVT